MSRRSFWIIRFGSRVEVYLPDGARVLAKDGQRTVAGKPCSRNSPADGGHDARAAHGTRAQRRGDV